MVAIDAERLIGSLLRGALVHAKADASTPLRPVSVSLEMASTVPATAVPSVEAAAVREPTLVARESAPVREVVRESAPAPQADRQDRGGYGDRRPRGFGDRERPGRERTSRRERDGRGGDRPSRPAPVAGGKPTKTDDGREFWEVWSEEVGRTPSATEIGNEVGKVEPAGQALPTPTSPTPREDAPAIQVASGQVRLYVNVGRKDGATAELVADMLSSSGATVPVTDVELMNTHCYVNVAKETAEVLCSGVHGKSHNGRAVICEPARPPKRRY